MGQAGKSRCRTEVREQHERNLQSLINGELDGGRCDRNREARKRLHDMEVIEEWVKRANPNSPNEGRNPEQTLAADGRILGRISPARRRFCERHLPEALK